MRKNASNDNFTYASDFSEYNTNETNGIHFIYQTQIEWIHEFNAKTRTYTHTHTPLNTVVSYAVRIL